MLAAPNRTTDYLGSRVFSPLAQAVPVISTAIVARFVDPPSMSHVIAVMFVAVLEREFGDA